MANMKDYIFWRGDLTFEQDSFNKIDSLILCQIAYLNFDNLIVQNSFKEDITISALAELFNNSKDFKERSNMGMLINAQTVDLLTLLASSKRYKDIKVLCYQSILDESQEEQFSAITFKIQDNYFVSFRGTDDTIVGWKEDFNLAIKENVPSQLDAVDYLENVSKNVKGLLFVGGHSKGGNLAVFASAYCSNKTQKRIIKIFNHDGPGFSEEIINSEQFQFIVPKLKSYYPHFSVVGMLFNRVGEYSIIESDETGLMQHDAFSWHIMGTDFVLSKKFASSSSLLSGTLNALISNLEPSQLELLIETLFDIAEATDSKTNSELKEDFFKNSKKIIKKIRALEPSTRKALSKTLLHISKIIGNQIPSFTKLITLAEPNSESSK